MIPSTSKTTTDPVCGMDVDPASAAGHSEYEGTTYHFCGASCKRKFDADPARYASKATSSKPSIDPICGLEVDPASAAGRRDYEGTSYLFCAASCKRKFDADPAHYAGKKGQAPHVHEEPAAP